MTCSPLQSDILENPSRANRLFSLRTKRRCFVHGFIPFLRGPTERHTGGPKGEPETVRVTLLTSQAKPRTVGFTVGLLCFVQSKRHKFMTIHL